MPKHDFLLSYELESVFDGFTDEQAGRLIKAMFDYEMRRELPVFDDPFLQMMFDNVIKQKIDENAKKYEETCKKNAENVRKRWGKTKGNTKHTSEYDRIPPNTNCTTEYDRIQNIRPNTDDTTEYDGYRYDIDNDNDKSLSISTECQSETEKIVRDFSQVIGKRKISVKKRFELMSKYKEMRAEKPKEEVDQALLDYLAQE